MRDIKPGDFVDVRMVAVSTDGNRVGVRLPAQSAVHQIMIAAHQVQNVEPRSPDAIAADVVCSSYDNVAPLRR